MGQNFLADRRLLARIAGYGKGCQVVEIGAGPGNLTGSLAGQATMVVAFEVDLRFIPLLARVAASASNVQVVPQDFLEVDLEALLGREQSWVCVSNLPYSASSPILFRLLDDVDRFRDLYVSLQLEVAERLTASPGSRRYGRLSVTAGLLTDAETLFRLPRRAFYPRPEVESAFVHLRPHRRHLDRLESREVFANLVRAAFGQRRKRIRNALRSAYEEEDDLANALERAGVNPTARAEELSVDHYVDLANAVVRVGVKYRGATGKG